MRVAALLLLLCLVIGGGAVSPAQGKSDMQYLTDAADSLTLGDVQENTAEGPVDAKEQVARMMAAEAQADAAYRRADGETDSAPANIAALLHLAPHKAKGSYELQNLIESEKEEDDEMLTPLNLIESAEGEGQQWPFTISQGQATRRHKRLMIQNRQNAAMKSRLMSHVPQLTDRYDDPAVPARLKAELRKFDQQNEKDHPELRKAKSTLGDSRDQSDDDSASLEGHTYMDPYADDKHSHHHTQRAAAGGVSTPVGDVDAEKVQEAKAYKAQIASGDVEQEMPGSGSDHASEWGGHAKGDDWLSKGHSNPNNPFFEEE